MKPQWILFALAVAVFIRAWYQAMANDLTRRNTVVECDCGHVIGAHVTGQGCIQCDCKENP